MFTYLTLPEPFTAGNWYYSAHVILLCFYLESPYLILGPGWNVLVLLLPASVCEIDQVRLAERLISSFTVDFESCNYQLRHSNLCLSVGALYYAISR